MKKKELDALLETERVLNLLLEVNDVEIIHSSIEKILENLKLITKDSNVNRKRSPGSNE